MKEISVGDKNYPSNLSFVAGCPEKLYVLGDLTEKDNFAVAIVGARDASAKGMALAKRFAQDLTEKGVTIVSGLAQGIDTAAHIGALAAKGRTIAVLAGGLDKIYPYENRSLAEKITKNGALVSEFPPGVTSLPPHFLARNRIISGLSLATLIIEGERRSGTLSTASHAATQGREVFVIPGSPATNYLLENGATPISSPQDILDSIL